MTTPGAAVILAAGRGERLGVVAKALLLHGGRSFLDLILDLAAQSGASDRRVVVAAPFATEVSAAARVRNAVVVENPDPSRGMASSIACGFSALLADSVATWALLWPVDHPRVHAATVVARLIEDDDCDAVIPTVHERGGHPIVVKRRLWAALAGCGDAPMGARSVLSVARVRRIACNDMGVIADVDVPADLETTP